MAEFTYGMAICQLFVRWPQLVRDRAADAVEIGLALAMVATLATADSPQAKALFTVLTGLFFLVTAHGAGIVSRILSTRVMLLLGGASYSLYILQQPVRAACALLIRAPFDQVASPVVTLIAAIAAFQLVEQPARRALLSLVRRAP
jgi:peptidoglycan/LPS O-acetylase OafA/YrhL